MPPYLVFSSWNTASCLLVKLEYYNIHYFSHAQIHSINALPFPIVKTPLLGKTRCPTRCFAPQNVHGLLSLALSTEIGPTDSKPESMFARNLQFTGLKPRAFKKYAREIIMKRMNYSHSQYTECVSTELTYRNIGGHKILHAHRRYECPPALEEGEYGTRN
jgi:hypothetical protein